MKELTVFNFNTHFLWKISLFPADGHKWKNKLEQVLFGGGTLKNGRTQYLPGFDCAAFSPRFTEVKDVALIYERSIPILAAHE